MANTGETLPENPANVEENLIKEFEVMFSREKLEKNNYFIYRMSMNLEIPLQAIYEERSIKSITQDSQIILNALKKTTNVKIDEEKMILIPSIKPLTNKIIVNIQQKDEQEFTNFLKNEKWACNDFVLVFDRPNSGRMIFNKESDAEEFIKFMGEKSFMGKKLEPYVEPENIFLTFLQNAQESKKSFTYSGAQVPRDNNYYYSQTMPMYQQPFPMMNANPYYYPYYPQYPNTYNPYYNPYMSSMYIRKAKDEEEYNEEAEEKYESYKPYWASENTKTQEPDYDYKGKYSSHSKRGKRGGRYSRGGGYKRYNDYNKGGEGNRVRLNSDNFPPLITENDKEKHRYDEKEKMEIKIKYKKADIHKIYQDIVSNGELKVDEKLATMKEEEIPFLLIHPALRKKSGN